MDFMRAGLSVCLLVTSLVSPSAAASVQKALAAGQRSSVAVFSPARIFDAAAPVLDAKLEAVYSPSLSVAGGLHALPGLQAEVGAAREAEAAPSGLLGRRETEKGGPAASPREQLRSAERLGGSPASASRWSRFWHGSASAQPSADPVLAEDAPAAPSSGLRAPRESRSKERLSPPAGSAAALGLAAASWPSFQAVAQQAQEAAKYWFLPKWEEILPFLQIGGGFVGIYAAMRSVQWALEALWRWKKWSDNSLVLAQLFSGVVIFIGGTMLSMALAGADGLTLLQSLNVNGLAVSLALKDLLGNLIHFGFFLYNRPFVIGEKVKIGDEEYALTDLTFRYLILDDGDGFPIRMTYTQLNGKSTMLYRTDVHGLPGVREAATALKSAAEKKDAAAGRAPGIGKRALRHLVRLALLAASLGVGGFLRKAGSPAAPLISGLSIAVATWFIERIVSDAAARRMRRRGVDPNIAALTRIGISMGLYAIGLSIALALAGLSFLTILKGASVLGVSVGIAATDLITNLIQASWLFLTQPFQIGDRIKVGEKQGVVTDMTVHYVKLKADSGGLRGDIAPEDVWPYVHYVGLGKDASPPRPLPADEREKTILLPYSLFVSTHYKVFKKYVKPEDSDPL